MNLKNLKELLDELKLIVENRNASKVINLRSYTILLFNEYD
jgi:hypothetical protein